MRISLLRAGGITWDEIESHPPVVSSHFGILSMRKVSDVKAAATDDALILAPEAVHGERERVVVGGLARIERGEDGMPLVIVRTSEGEYEGWICGCEGMDPPEVIEWNHGKDGMESIVGMSPEELKALQVGWHAALLARQRITRATAARLPRQAGALMGLASGGRELATRGDAIVAKLKGSMSRHLVGGRERELVTVDVVLPPSSKAASLRFQADAYLFPIHPPVERAEIMGEIGRAITRAVGSARGLQTFLAGMAVIEHQGGVELDEDGEVPKRFRLDVMELMGMPSRTANKRQREAVEQVLRILVDAELMVRPYRKAKRSKAEYVPILVRQSFHDAPGTGERRARRVMLNPALVPDMADGKLWRIPMALMRVGDDEDLDGVIRLVGFRLAFRIGMGTGRGERRSHEKLATFLQAAGLDGWAERVKRDRGEPEVMRRLRAAVERLRALPMVGYPTQDVAGSVEIEGEHLARAIVRYRNPPPWAHSSPGDMVADMSRHVRQAPD